MAMEWTYLKVGMIGTNCYLVKDLATGKGAIIDPGDRPDQIMDAADHMGMTPEVILLTHGHFDHILAVNHLKELCPGIKVYIHPNDNGMDQPYGYPSPEGTDLYVDGSVVKIGETEFHVIHTPGHTKGSVTLRCDDVLFTGDTMFKNDMGRTDFPGGSDEEIFASLIRISELPGDYYVCPGHEGLSTLEQERQTNYCLHYALKNRK